MILLITYLEELPIQYLVIVYQIQIVMGYGILLMFIRDSMTHFLIHILLKMVMLKRLISQI